MLDCSALSWCGDNISRNKKKATNAESSCSSTWVSLITQESRGVFVNIIAAVCKVVWRKEAVALWQVSLAASAIPAKTLIR